MNSSFLTEPSGSKILEVSNITEENSQEFTNISDQIVSAYTDELDSLMVDMNNDIIKKDASDLLLEKYWLELINMLCFMGQKLETIGIKDDLSKLSAKEVYNDAYLNTPASENGKKTTVAELTAIAENKSRYETIMNNIYSRAYKQIKFKIDAGYEMLSSLRKIISKRMQEAQLNMIPRGMGDGLNIVMEDNNV